MSRSPSRTSKSPQKKKLIDEPNEIFPDEMMLKIAESDPKAFRNLSQTSKKWRKEYENKYREQAEKEFFQWLFSQILRVDQNITVTRGKIRGKKVTKQIFLDAIFLDIFLDEKENIDIPPNWNFLPNLQNLIIKKYVNTKLPILPENLKFLEIIDSKIKYLNNLPNNLVSLTFKSSYPLEKTELPSSIRKCEIIIY